MGAKYFVINMSDENINDIYDCVAQTPETIVTNSAGTLGMVKHDDSETNASLSSYTVKTREEAIITINNWESE